MNRLVIIDGNAILHRAYHALPPLTDPHGVIVNAVYGFTNILHKIFQDLAPSHIAVAFDRAAPTFRKKLYKKYQATRPKLDADLIPQIAIVHEVVEAMGIPIFEKDGFEADDLIGTLCKTVHSLQFTVNGNDKIDQVIVVTGDRDILQLVEEGKVYIYMPTKGLSESKLYGEKETVERMGVRPTQIADLKALAGDQSDNYPGIEGIGPKTAVTLLQKYGSVEGLYEQGEKNNWADVGEKLKKKLTLGKQTALLMRQLATIHRDVPIEVQLTPIPTLVTPKARLKLDELGFKNLLNRLIENSADTGKNKENKEKKTNKKDKSPPEDNGQLSLV